MEFFIGVGVGAILATMIFVGGGFQSPYYRTRPRNWRSQNDDMLERQIRSMRESSPCDYHDLLKASNQGFKQPSSQRLMSMASPLHPLPYSLDDDAGKGPSKEG